MKSPLLSAAREYREWRLRVGFGKAAPDGIDKIRELAARYHVDACDLTRRIIKLVGYGR